MDMALLNADKNNKIIRTSHRNIENEINPFIKTFKKTRTYQTKTFTVTIFQKNSSQPTIIIIDNNHLIKIPIAEDLQIEEIHKKSYKIDIIDQTVKATNIETITQDQTQREVITQIIAETVPIQTLEYIFFE